jgi:hypothetical protein
MDKESTWHEWAERLVKRVRNAFPNPEEFDNWELCEELIFRSERRLQAN